MAIPEGIGFEALQKILLGYLRAGAGERSVSRREVADRAGLDVFTVSRNNEFLVSVGLLREEEKGRYRLSEQGIRFATALQWRQESEARRILAELLQGCDLARRVLDYVAINQQVARSDVVSRIGSMLSLPSPARFGTGINAFIDMLCRITGRG